MNGIHIQPLPGRLPMQNLGPWRVYVNGKDTGIVETNFQAAYDHWTNRHKETGRTYLLAEVAADKKRA